MSTTQRFLKEIKDLDSRFSALAMDGTTIDAEYEEARKNADEEYEREQNRISREYAAARNRINSEYEDAQDRIDSEYRATQDRISSENTAAQDQINSEYAAAQKKRKDEQDQIDKKHTDERNQIDRNHTDAKNRIDYTARLREAEEQQQEAISRIQSMDSQTQKNVQTDMLMLTQIEERLQALSKQHYKGQDTAASKPDFQKLVS